MTEDYYEIRVYLIGDEAVGKHSIANRFLKLNLSKTIHDNYFIKQNPKKKSNIKNTIKNKIPTNYLEYNSMQTDQRNFIRKEKFNILTTTKILTLENSTIFFNFFPIVEADKLDYLSKEEKAKEGDDDYEFEQYYRISLRNMKKEIKKYLMKKEKNANNNLEHVFLFVWDLQDFSTLEKIKIIYNELNKYFAIDSNYVKSLIGNKIDTKMISKEQQQKLEIYIKENNFNYYEINTFMKFNFENFFEKFFYDNLIHLNDFFNTNFFKNKFHLLLSKRSNFSRGPRSALIRNDNPAPNTYDNDVYDYPKDKQEFQNVFYNGKNGRFVNKIFIEKKGPIIPILKEEENKKKNKKNDEEEEFFNKMNKKYFKNNIEPDFKGFSLGIKPGHYNLKENRKQSAKIRARELEKILLEDANQLHIKNPPKFKENNYDLNKKENLNELVNIIKERENEGKKRKIINEKKNEELQKKRINSILEKQNKYQKKFEEREKELLLNKQGLYHPPTILPERIQQKRAQSAGLNRLYDVRTKYDPNKGWSMGMKLDYTPYKNKDDPDFPNFESEFDKIANHPKYAEIKYTAPRFKDEKVKPKIKKYKTQKFPYEEKKDKIENAIKNGERNKNLEGFLNDRQRDLQRVMQNKNILEYQRQKELEKLIERIPKNGQNQKENYYLNDINYNLVEEASPNYTMKGRYLHGSIFDVGDVYERNTFNKFDDDENIGSNGKPIQNEEYINNLPVPQFNAVRPHTPGFFFSKADRFYVKPLYSEKPNAEKYIPFKDGKFKPDDHVSFSNGNYMGTAGKIDYKAMNKKKLQEFPGPGQYKIKGFAEVIVEEGKKISDVRAKIIKEKKEEENKKNNKGKKEEMKVYEENNKNEDVNYDDVNEDNFKENEVVEN